METKTINLRDLPDDFVRRVKAYAALSGLTIKEFMIHAAEKAMTEAVHARGMYAGFVEAKKRKK